MTYQDVLKRIKYGILIRVFPVLILSFMRLLAIFVRFEFRISPQCLEKIENDEPCIIAFWHGELLFQSFAFKRYLRGKRAWVLISRHFDGEVISRVVRHFGIYALRGSSSKGGIRTLYRAIQKLKQKEYVVITPDGPRGPYHSVSDGIVLLAQKTNLPIVISRAFYTRYWEFRSWDRFQIPKPFSKVVFVIKEPFRVDSMELGAAKAYVKEKMEED